LWHLSLALRVGWWVVLGGVWWIEWLESGSVP